MSKILILIAMLLCGLVFINLMMTNETEVELESYSASFSPKTKAGGTNVKTNHGKSTHNIKTNSITGKTTSSLVHTKKKKHHEDGK